MKYYSNKSIQNFMLKTFVLLITFWVSLSMDTYANIIVIDGIGYELNSSLRTATVTSLPEKNNYSGAITSSSGEKYSGYIKIPNEAVHNNVTYSVTSIGSRAFYKCSDLTAVKIPNSVTSIDDEAFSGCHALTSLILGNNIVSIGVSAFAGCRMSSLDIPNSVTYIGEYNQEIKGETNVEIIPVIA